MLGCKASSSRHQLKPSLLDKQAHKHRGTGRKDKVAVGRVRRGKSISRPAAHLPHLCDPSPARPNVPSEPFVVLIVSVAYSFRRITTQTAGQLSLLSNPASSSAALHREPSRSRGFQLPSPSPSPFLILSTPPQLQRGTLDARTWSNPLSFDSNPIQSRPTSPVLSSHSPIRPSQSPPPTDSPRTGQPGSKSPPSAFLLCLLLAARPPCGPWNPEPLPHQTLQLSVYRILHSSSHRPAASVSVSICRLLSSLLPFTDLQPSLPGRLSSCHLPPLPPISPSRSLAAATTLVLSRINNTGLLASLQPRFIYNRPPTRQTRTDRSASPARHSTACLLPPSTLQSAIEWSQPCLVIRQDAASQPALTRHKVQHRPVST